MTMSQRILGATALAAGLTLLAGCGEETVDDIDRIDAAPAAKVSADAIDPPEDEGVITSDALENTDENQGY